MWDDDEHDHGDDDQCPDTIEITGTPTIIRLCKFGADQGMDGSSWGDIVERLLDLVEDSEKKND